MSFIDDVKEKAKKIPLWGWGLIGGGALLLLGGGTAVAYEYNGWDPATVTDWLNQAIAAVQNAGYDTSNISLDDLLIIAKGESDGNPNAVQGSDVVDVNTASGDLAKGMMQTISATFNQYKLPSLPDDIFNPISNAAASILYILHRYGSSANVPGVVAVNNGNKYVGY